MIVIDVVSRTHCSCQTEDGIFLDSVDISMLETVIPRDDPAYVMVVSGKRKGQVCFFQITNFWKFVLITTSFFRSVKLLNGTVNAMSPLSKRYLIEMKFLRSATMMCANSPETFNCLYFCIMPSVFFSFSIDDDFFVWLLSIYFCVDCVLIVKADSRAKKLFFSSLSPSVETLTCKSYEYETYQTSQLPLEWNFKIRAHGMKSTPLNCLRCRPTDGRSSCSSFKYKISSATKLDSCAYVTRRSKCKV